MKLDEYSRINNIDTWYYSRGLLLPKDLWSQVEIKHTRHSIGYLENITSTSNEEFLSFRWEDENK